MRKQQRPALAAGAGPITLPMRRMLYRRAVAFIGRATGQPPTVAQRQALLRRYSLEERAAQGWAASASAQQREASNIPSETKTATPIREGGQHGA